MIPEVIKKEVKDLTPEFNNALKVKILSFDKNTKTVKIEIDDIFQTADFIEIETANSKTQQNKNDLWKNGSIEIDINSLSASEYIIFRFGKSKKSDINDILYSAETILYPKNIVSFTESSTEIDDDELLEDFYDENDKEDSTEDTATCDLKVNIL
jgi:hypothetical protein